jgi:hypothetical protein
VTERGGLAELGQAMAGNATNGFWRSDRTKFGQSTHVARRQTTGTLLAVTSLQAMEISQKIREEIKRCQFSAVIYLSNYRLLEFPAKILNSAAELQMLRRLDLSYNNITEVPAAISELTELRELWLQHNPLLTLPAAISNCVKLEIIDLKSTKVTALPAEICNLKKLYELDYRETPFARLVLKKYDIHTTGPTGLVILKKIFQEKFERQCLKDSTVEKLLSELYMKESDHPDSRRIVEDMVEVRFSPCWLCLPLYLILPNLP